MRIALLALLLVLTFHSKAQETLKLGAAEWCPYTCSDPENPGIITEYLTWLFARHKIQLEVTTLPWSRVLKALDKGELDGLATFIEGETNNVVRPDTPTFYVQHCFFTRADNTWKYTSLNDLSNMNLGVAMGYGYDGGPVDAYINNHHESVMQVQKINDKNPTKRLLKMVQSRRINTFLDDPYIVAWQQKEKPNSDAQTRNAGCLPSTPVYMAFSNKNPLAVKKMMRWLNSELKKPRSLQKLQSIKTKYLGDELMHSKNAKK